MRYFLTFILLFLHNICDAQEKIYKSNVCCSRTVTIVNDTVLKYFERIGSFSNKGTLKYKLDNGIFTVERKPNKYQKSAFTLGNDLNGSELKISKDSLVILKTGAVFYDEKFLEQKVEKEFVNFYLIKDKKKYLLLQTI